MSKISVITPTIRPEGLPLVRRALENQTFKDFEWIIVAPKEQFEAIRKIVVYGVQPFFFKICEEPSKKGDFWNLNKAYNEGIRHADGELIVSWQDYTYAKPETLEKFWFFHEREPNILIGAVGNKYKTVVPELGAMVWKDPRERSDQGSYYLCDYPDIEWNLCSCPRQALYDIGGFDEELDSLGYGMDGYSVNERIFVLKKYDFKLNQEIKSYSLPHGRPKDWEEHNNIHQNYKKRQEFYVANGPVLPYLKGGE